MSIFKRGASSIAPTVWLCLLVMAVLMVASGCASRQAAQDESAHSASMTSENDATVDGLTISKAMASEAPLAGGNGAVYLTIRSEKPDQVTSVESPAATMAEFHESMDDNGVMRMAPRSGGFEIPAGGEVELTQGSKHIMLMDLTNPLVAGDEIQVILNFRDHAPITITVPVMALGEMHRHK